MLNNNGFYGLSNPGLNTDIGDAYFNNMYPQFQFMDGNTYIPGVTGTMNGVQINGCLTEDTFERGRKGGLSLLAKVALGALTIGAGLLCLRGIKVGAKSLWDKIVDFFKGNNNPQQNNNLSLWQRIKNLFKKNP